MSDKTNAVWVGMGGEDERLTGGHLSPAYGRDYKNGKEAEAAFRDGKMFTLNTHTGSGYVNISNFRPGATVNIRFKRQTQVKVVKV